MQVCFVVPQPEAVWAERLLRSDRLRTVIRLLVALFPCLEGSGVSINQGEDDALLRQWSLETGWLFMRPLRRDGLNGPDEEFEPGWFGDDSKN